jgi:hypothetical protein
MMPRSNVVTAGLAAVLLLLDGCAYHRLVTKRPNPADQTYHPVETSALAWGASEERRVAEKCETSLLSEVRVRTSLAQALATVLTLGFWQPSRIEYRCSKAPTAAGEIEDSTASYSPGDDDEPVSRPRPR